MLKKNNGRYRYLGLVDYAQALELQKETARKIQAGEGEDTLYFLQHPPVITLGKQGNRKGLLISKEEMAQRRISLVHSDRGGDITYHGPGQLMVYPIIRLTGHYGTPKKYIQLLEQAVLDTLQTFGIIGNRDPQHPGVWLENKKIAAVGVRIQKGVALHGLCVNVHPEDDYSLWIVPCGITQRGVTSLLACLGETPSMEVLVEEFVAHFSRLFAIRLICQ